MSVKTTLQLLAALGLTVGAACSPSAPPAPAVLDAQFPDGRRTEELDRLAREVRLDAGANIAVQPLARDAHASHQLVAIREGEQPHVHAHHDLTVVVLEGHGTMLLGGEVRTVGEGSILYIPRGTVHAFRNASDRPAVAYTIFSPPFDGKDRVPVRPAEPASP